MKKFLLIPLFTLTACQPDGNGNHPGCTMVNVEEHRYNYSEQLPDGSWVVRTQVIPATTGYAC